MALAIRVDATGHWTFAQPPDSLLDTSMLHKGQQEPFLAFIQARHPLPYPLSSRLQRTLRYGSCWGQMLWFLGCCCCCDQDSWDTDRDTDLLAQHVRSLLNGILQPDQYEITEQYQGNVTWEDGRAVLKLWIKDPSRPTV